MSIRKTEMKMLLLREEGSELEQTLEAQEKTTAGHKHAASVLRDQAEKLVGFVGGLDFEEPGLDPEQVAWVKKQLTRIVIMVENRAEEQKASQLHSAGSESTLRRLLDKREQQYKVEKAKLEAALEAIEEPPPAGERPVGVRPPPSEAAQRKEAEKEAPKPKRRRSSRKPKES